MLRSMGFIIHGDAALNDDQQTYGPNVTFKMPTKMGHLPISDCVYIYIYIYIYMYTHCMYIQYMHQSLIKIAETLLNFPPPAVPPAAGALAVPAAVAALAFASCAASGRNGVSPK